MTGTDAKSNKVIKLKKRISEELNEIDKDIKNMEKSKKDSVDKIEIKKVELKKFNDTQAVCDEHYATLQEIEQASKLIEKRNMSITALDNTIANLDSQISKIQSEHDKAVAELEKKRRKLNEYLKYYDDLNDKLEKLIALLGEEEMKHCIELNQLKAERAKALARTDLSENALNELLKQLDNKMVALSTEHGNLIDSISQKLSEITVDASGVEELLSDIKKKPPTKKKEKASDGEGETEEEDEQEEEQDKKQGKIKKKQKQLEDVRPSTVQEKLSKSKQKLGKKKHATEGDVQDTDDESFEMDDEEILDWFTLNDKDFRLDLLRKGMQITPSNRIITKDDRILTMKQAQSLGLFSEILEEEEESAEKDELEILRDKIKKSREIKYYRSVDSSASTLGKESSESRICGKDTEYLKAVFGKSLTIALAEITAVQPIDPVHYLAHWMLKYRYNQEIDQITRIQIQELMVEQERLAAEKWHRELQEEARLAVLEALFRAENIIIQQEFQSQIMQEYEGE